MLQKLKPKSRENLGKIMSRYYEGNHVEAAKGKFVIWIAITAPTELLKATLQCVPPERWVPISVKKPKVSDSLLISVPMLVSTWEPSSITGGIPQVWVCPGLTF